MKKTITLLLLFPLFSLSFGQVLDTEEALKSAVSNDTIEGWQLASKINLNFSQTGLTNWAGGGENSLTLNGLFSGTANYDKGKFNWDNSIDLGYGLLRQGKDAQFRKSDDKIDLASKAGYEAFNKWNYAAILNFRTQFSDGFNYPDTDNPISRFMAPAYLTSAIGLDYKPSKNLTAFISPVSSKTTFVNDQRLADSAAFGVEPGKKIRNEFGGYFRAAYKTELMKNVEFETKLDLFSNFLEKPENVDVNWETLFTIKANKYVAATFSTHLIYDDDVNIEEDTTGDGVADKKGPRLQFKEVLAIGLTLSF